MYSHRVDKETTTEYQSAEEHGKRRNDKTWSSMVAKPGFDTLSYHTASRPTSISRQGKIHHNFPPLAHNIKSIIVIGYMLIPSLQWGQRHAPTRLNSLDNFNLVRPESPCRFAGQYAENVNMIQKQMQIKWRPSRREVDCGDRWIVLPWACIAQVVCGRSVGWSQSVDHAGPNQVINFPTQSRYSVFLSMKCEYMAQWSASRHAMLIHNA